MGSAHLTISGSAIAGARREYRKIRRDQLFRKTAFGFALATTLLASAASATPFTTTSPTNGGQLLPAGVTQIGGIVFDMIGLNGTHIVSQLSASSLYVGFSGAANPLTIGTQTGFTAALLGNLGGGLAQLAVRISLYNGDTGVGDFDENENTLLINGVDIGNFTAVLAEQTTADGLTQLDAPDPGFENNVLETGFFFETNAADLLAIYNSLVATGQAVVALNDVDPDDNFFDLTQGVDGSLVNVGTGPQVVSEAGTLGLLGLGMVGLGAAARRRRSA
jgi:hypothetical protein